MDAPRHSVERLVTWFQMGGITVHAGTRVDGLTVMMLFVVTFVSLMVHVYSLGYMHGDRRFTYFYAALSLFTASMLTLVVAPNTLQLLVGWELVGVCSFMLIGHWWEEEVNSAAAIKAFITTRIGDVGLMLGIITLFFAAGKTFDIVTLNRLALTGAISHHLLLVGALLLLLGVVGKSAQFPLHVWLPDAMAGPTPISALIHAATMVAAGIYIVARLYPVFLAAPVALTVLGIIACITMLGAALAALADDDLKRVLAWSTVSQLAYMAAGLAVGGWTASVYHLLTHAAFKALLFLAAGSVLRSVGTNLMSEMGGLWRAMPVTAATAAIGSLSLAGVPPFAGAFSKDGIIAAAHERGGGLGTAVYVVGLVTAAVTAAYVTRMFIRTFLGRYRGAAQLHESPLVMTGPLVLLAVFVLGLGAPALPSRFGVARWLDAPAATRPPDVGVAGVAVTTVIAF